MMVRRVVARPRHNGPGLATGAVTVSRPRLDVAATGDGAMAVNETVEVKCSECGKQGRVGIAFQYLTDPRPRCNRGIRADKALRCPALLRALSEARSKLKRG
jgi:hypothetical protein